MQAQGLEFGEYINPDDIAASLRGSYQDRVRAAQQISDEKRDECIASRRDFAFETVMSHPSKIEVMRRARVAGFHVTLFFVGTEDPRINVARVEARVRLGGHSVPEALVVARYHRTMNALAAATATANRTVVFDNSRTDLDNGLRALLELCCDDSGDRKASKWIRSSSVLWALQSDKVPGWIKTYLLEPLRLDPDPPLIEGCWHRL